MDRENDRIDEPRPASAPRLGGSRRSLNDQLHLLVGELVDRGVTLAQARQEFERQFIAASIRSSEGNLCRSARRLGVHRNTLRNKVTRLGIELDELDAKNAARPRLSRARSDSRS